VNFEFAFQPVVERSRIDTLATGTWIRNVEVVVMQASPGVGKPRLLAALGIRAVQLGFSVQYSRFNEHLAALRHDDQLPPPRIKMRE